MGPLPNRNAFFHAVKIQNKMYNLAYKFCQKYEKPLTNCMDSLCPVQVICFITWCTLHYL